MALGALIVLVASALLAVVPQRLIAEVSGRAPARRGAAWLALAAATVGLAALAAAVALGGEAQAWRWGVLAACLCALMVVDARYLVIPDVYVVALLALAIGWVGWLPALLGAALGAGLLALVRWAFLRLRGVEALGLGDVKLMAALGALAGAEGVLWIIVTACAIGAVLVLIRGRSAGGAFQLAPLGACAAVPALVVLALGRFGGVTGVGQRGFSLIEALVALIIAAMALAGVLELQRQLADGQARYQRALDLAGLERNAMALTANLNPTDQPQGHAGLAGGRSLVWRAEPIGAPALNTGSRTAGRRFELRLYQLDIWLYDAQGRPLGQFAYNRVGWRKLDAPAPFVPPPAPAPPPTLAAPGPTMPTGPVL